eukprot:8646485-Alexandrium_andersonii.AAC.1
MAAEADDAAELLLLLEGLAEGGAEAGAQVQAPPPACDDSGAKRCLPAGILGPPATRSEADHQYRRNRGSVFQDHLSGASAPFPPGPPEKRF